MQYICNKLVILFVCVSYSSILGSEEGGAAAELGDGLGAGLPLAADRDRADLLRREHPPRHPQPLQGARGPLPLLRQDSEEDHEKQAGLLLSRRCWTGTCALFEVRFITHLSQTTVVFVYMPAEEGACEGLEWYQTTLVGDHVRILVHSAIGSRTNVSILILAPQAVA